MTNKIFLVTILPSYTLDPRGGDVRTAPVLIRENFGTILLHHMVTDDLQTRKQNT